ncbi:MAG: ACT domain-containing protein [Eubacteriales bacterium]|nr:ACT domain-containing protein [Eubacteriales bacterium]
MDSTFILVDRTVAPDVLVKVVDAKEKLSSGRYKTINDALSAANISRSAFYKYKNYVFAHSKFDTEQIVTLFFTLDDVAGILSDILILLSDAGANILTINQNIPINGSANVTISMRTDNMAIGLEMMITKLKSVDGVNKIELLSM